MWVRSELPFFEKVIAIEPRFEEAKRYLAETPTKSPTR